MPKLLSLLLLIFCYSCTSQKSPYYLNVKDFGATGTKSQLATKSIQAAIDSCHAQGGGTVYFPPGEYTAASLLLKSNVTLHLEAGSVLYASKNEEDYVKRGRYKALINADKAENIGICGKGKIDGQATYLRKPRTNFDNFAKEQYEIAIKAGVPYEYWQRQPAHIFMTIFKECKNLKMTEVTLVNSPIWCLHIEWCENVFIDNIAIFSDLEKGVNSDGIDIDCSKNVVISNCIIATADDAICMKTKNPDKSCEDITVSNCILTSTSTALKLGTESRGDFKNINFNNCVIKNSNRGLSIVVRDGATVENVNFSDIIVNCNRKEYYWWGSADPIWLVVRKRNKDSKVGTIKNVTFNNIIAHGQGTSKIEGFDTRNIENIKLNNLQFFMHPEDAIDKRATHAFFARNVDGLTLSDVSVSWDKYKPEAKWQDAFNFLNINGLHLNGLKGKQAPTAKNGSFISLQKVNDAIIERCIATKNTNRFINISIDCQNIHMSQNFTKNAKSHFSK